MAAMVLSAIPLGAAGGPEGVAAPRSVTNDSNDLIIPEGEVYELSGCHTYKKSVQIMGVLNIKPYDGKDESTGMLWLKAPNITIGGSGAILGQGRGFGGGGGGSTYYDSSAQGGKGGEDGKGGDGGNGYQYYDCGGGGGGSNGGNGGNPGQYGGNKGEAGTEQRGGKGGDYSSYTGGAGGPGFGGGGGGGSDSYYGAGGGGGGGTGGKDANAQNGGKGAGTFGGTGAPSSGGGYTTGTAGKNGGYMSGEGNGDSSVNMSVFRGSGGGGGGGMNYGCGGAGGGGAGGAFVVLESTATVSVSGIITASGAGGGKGGSYGNSYYGGAGGGGAGGGIALQGMRVIISGAVNALGYDGSTPSSKNGGTVKLLYGEVLQNNGNVQAGRVYTNARPKMQGLDTPLPNAQTYRKPNFKWYPAVDPEKDPITYEIELSTTPGFTTVSRRKADIEERNYTFENNPLSGTMYWRVRGVDLAGGGGWSEVRKFIVDDKTPTSRIDLLPEYVTSQDFTVSWTGEDNAGGSGVASYTILVSDNGADAYKWLENYNSTAAVFPGTEAHSYRMWSLATDFASNTESLVPEAVVTTTVDSVAPTASISGMSLHQSKPNFMVAWTGKDSTSGIADYTIYVSIDGGTFAPWLENSTETMAQYRGSDGHRYTFFVLARDVAGNVQALPGSERYVSTTVDGTAPITKFAPSAPYYGSAPTYIGATSVIYLDATDNFAGIEKTSYIIDTRVQQDYTKGFRELQGGSHNITYWSIDAAGNEETKHMTWFWIDGEAPVTTLALLGPNWTTEARVYISGQTLVSFDVYDKGSGMNRTVYNIDGSGYVTYNAPFKMPKSGLHNMKYYSIDNLGQADAEKNVSIVVDIWSPSSVAVVDSKVSNQDVVVELRGTDLESGLAGVYYRIVKRGELAMNFVNGTQVTIPAASDHSLDGNYTIEFYALDNVGNKEETRKVDIVIDTVGTIAVDIRGNPTVNDPMFRVAGTVEPGSTLTVNGLKVLVQRDGSFDYEMELKEGKNKIVVISTDKAGNSATVTKYATYTKQQDTGWLMTLLVVVIIIVAVVIVLLVLMRPRRAPAPAPQAPPPVPPVK